MKLLPNEAYITKSNKINVGKEKDTGYYVILNPVKGTINHDTLHDLVMLMEKNRQYVYQLDIHNDSTIYLKLFTNGTIGGYKVIVYKSYSEAISGIKLGVDTVRVGYNLEDNYDVFKNKDFTLSKIYVGVAR